ncbi:MAG: CoA transferase [Rhodospirillales bacterium]
MRSEAETALADLWRLGGGQPEALERAELPDEGPYLASAFKVDLAAQASIAAATLAAAELWRLRSGEAAAVSVARRHATAEFLSERYLRVDAGEAAELWDRIAGAYRCGDGRWVRLHSNFPHHRDGLLALLGCAYSREAVAEALMGWEGEAFEEAAAAKGLCVALLRPAQDWDAHPQGQAVAALPLLSIERIGAAPPEPLPPATRPLAGLRVLDLTRILAGPVAGRCLAAQGAEVLRVSAPHLPFILPAVIDTGRGKRACSLDLRTEEGREGLSALLREADVFLQAYRPGGLDALGFGPEAVAALRPGIVYATLSAYGPTGPWSGRRGFDSLVQTASGFNRAEAEAFGEAGPRALPCQALDHASGYLLAFGILRALAKRAEEGGSWRVRVTLAATGQWLRGLGQRSEIEAPALDRAEIADLLEESDSPFGRLSALRHAGRIEGHPSAWQAPAVPLGSHPPRWRST